MKPVWNNLRARRLPRADAGASAVEYALLITGIALVIVAAVFALGGPLAEIFTTTNDCFDDPTACT